MAKKKGKTGRRTPTAAQKAEIKRISDRKKDTRQAKALLAAKRSSVRHAAGHSPMSKKFASSQVDARTTSRVKGKDGLHDIRFIRDDFSENTFKEKQFIKEWAAARVKERTTEKTYKQKKAESTEKTAAQKKAARNKKRPTNRRKVRFGKV